MSEHHERGGPSRTVGGDVHETVVTKHVVADEGESTSAVVVEAIAEARGVSPVDIRRPLYEVVEPDALDDLFTSVDEETGGHVYFTFGGCEVTVTAAGEVWVEPIR